MWPAHEVCRLGARCSHLVAYVLHYCLTPGLILAPSWYILVSMTVECSPCTWLTLKRNISSHLQTRKISIIQLHPGCSGSGTWTVRQGHADIKACPCWPLNTSERIAMQQVILVHLLGACMLEFSSNSHACCLHGCRMNLHHMSAMPADQHCWRPKKD